MPELAQSWTDPCFVCHVCSASKNTNQVILIVVAVTRAGVLVCVCVFFFFSVFRRPSIDCDAVEEDLECKYLHATTRERFPFQKHWEQTSQKPTRPETMYARVKSIWS